MGTCRPEYKGSLNQRFSGAQTEENQMSISTWPRSHQTHPNPIQPPAGASCSRSQHGDLRVFKSKKAWTIQTSEEIYPHICLLKLKCVCTIRVWSGVSEPVNICPLQNYLPYMCIQTHGRVFHLIWWCLILTCFKIKYQSSRSFSRVGFEFYPGLDCCLWWLPGELSWLQ